MGCSEQGIIAKEPIPEWEAADSGVPDEAPPECSLALPAGGASPGGGFHVESLHPGARTRRYPAPPLCVHESVHVYFNGALPRGAPDLNSSANGRGLITLTTTRTSCLVGASSAAAM